MGTPEPLREWFAKWLASVVENGEPYDDLETMPWSDFAGGEEHAEAFRELADKALEGVLKQLAPYRHLFGTLCSCGYVREGDVVISWKAIKAELGLPDKGCEGKGAGGRVE